MNTALLTKEIRALLPIWAACLVTLAGGYLQQHGVLMELSVAVFVAAPALLCAHALGHEYSFRTLPSMLAQPIDRRHLFMIKWLVSAVMSLSLVAVAAFVLSPYARGMWEHWNVSILPLVGGLFVAPWLAMVLGGTLASALAAGTLFGMCLMLPSIVLAIWSGSTVDAAQDRMLAPWSAAMMILSAITAVLAFQQFTRLEAGDGHARSFTLPRFGTSTARQFRPIAALAGKELQLQQLTLALALLFIVMTIVLVILQRTVTSWLTAPIGAIVSLYCILLSLVIGAMASAEERQLGVAEWQLIQPASGLTQWSVKVIVSLGLALTFAAALPAVLVRLAVNPGETALFQSLFLPTVFLTATGLYLSSLTNSGTWALVLSLPTGVGLLIYVRFLESGPLAVTGLSISPATPMRPLALVTIPMLLWLAYLNHGTGERKRTSIIWQAAAFAVVIAVTRYVTLTV